MGIGIHEVEVMHETYQELRRREIAAACDKERRLSGDLLTLWTGIREFVLAEVRLAKAELKGTGAEVAMYQEQSSRMETSVREQLEILDERVRQGQAIARQFRRMR